ncbi:hypothetical protein MKD38_11000 [Cupriavidus sp. WGlv3]|uniref:hypothetical protein n=1 Tax=Cupriavidus sp. WGlv3 TaxID=2919924 RepID=UPI0020901CDA|nr:hypothetical protein [Cupriavidus sp. WGlv3]MCO4862205.1 hypothetical protein [Cupriavidus sp. WGlv3]
MVDPIYRKTEAGQDEIRSRARKLDHKLRALLLMVNGERREQALLAQVAGMGIGPEAMATLLAHGLVEAVAEPAQPPTTAPQESARVAPPAADTNLFSVYAMRHAPVTEVAAPPTSAAAAHSPAEVQAYQRLYHFYTDVIGQHLGLRGYMLQVKVEKAADLPALMALREPLHAALLKARGDITARAIMAQLDQVRDGSAA